MLLRDRHRAGRESDEMLLALGVGPRGEDDRHRHVRTPEEPVRLRARDVLELQARRRELAREVAQQIKEKRQLERHVDAHVEKGLGQPEELRGAALEPLGLPEHPQGAGQELLARRGELRGRASHEKPDAELVLHARNVGRDHRLAAPESTGRGRKGALRRNGGKAPHLFDRNRHD